MRTKPATLGLRVHCGWATAIALAGPSTAPSVIARSQLNFANPAFPGSDRPFHFVELMSLSEASAIIARCWKYSFELAVDAMAGFEQELKHHGYSARACGILQGRITEMPELEKILAAHPNFYQMASTAEGVMFRELMFIAAEASGMRVMKIPEFNLEEKAPELLALTPSGLMDRLTEMGPNALWTLDEKYATCAAWLALSAQRF